MKTKPAFQRLTALGLSLFLLMAATPAALATDSYTAGLDTVVRYGFRPLEDRDAFYCVELDQVWTMDGLGLMMESLEDGEKPNGYNAYFEKMQAVHGDPVPGGAGLFTTLMNQGSDGEAWTNDPQRAACWDLGSGQLAFLVDVGGESKLCFYVPASGAAAKSTAGLPYGVTWDLAADGMKEIASAANGEEPEAIPLGEYTGYTFQNPSKADGALPYALYVFKAEQLAVFGETANARDLPEGRELSDVYNDELASMTARHGVPTTGDSRQFLSLYHAFSGCDMAQSDIDRYAGWDLGDGSQLSLFSSYGDRNLGLLYYKTDRLQAAAAEEDGAQTVAAQSGGERSDYEQYIRDHLRYDYMRQENNWSYIFFVINRESGFIKTDQSEDPVENMQDRISARMEFDEQYGKLKDQYGEPSNYDKERFLSMFQNAEYDAYDEVFDLIVPEGFDLQEQDIEQFTGWDLENGKEIVLLRANGNCLLFVFTDMTRYVPEEAADVSEPSGSDSAASGDTGRVVVSYLRD